MIWMISLNLTAIVLSVISIAKTNEVWEYLLSSVLLYANVYLILRGIELYLMGGI